MKESTRKMRWYKPFLLCFVCMGIAGMLLACDRKEEKQQNADTYIAVICKGSQHEFWKTVEQGAMDAGEEMNIRVTFTAPEDESQIDVQIAMVEEAIEQGADGIVLAPLDTEKLNGVIEKAQEKGIPVLTLDSDVTSDSRVATIGTNNISAGAIAARNAAAIIGGEGQVAVVGHVEGAQTAIDRYEGFMDELARNYPDKIEVVGITYCNGDFELAKEQTIAFLKKYPDIRCLYGTNEGCAVGIAAALEEIGMEKKVQVIGFDSSDKEIAYLRNGTIDGIMVQNPYNMGYLGVRNLNKVLKGEHIDERIDTGATYVNSDNLEAEDTQWLLYPLGKD